MAKKTIGIDFSEIDKLTERLKEVNGDVKKISEKALEKSQEYVIKNVHQEMKKHKQTGDTEKSIVENPKVKWVGSTASIDVGFDISKGGLPSIFLMYGTPRIKKDQKLYNAIYGKKTSNEIADIQKNVFSEEIGKLGG